MLFSLMSHTATLPSISAFFMLVFDLISTFIRRASSKLPTMVRTSSLFRFVVSEQTTTSTRSRLTLCPYFLTAIENTPEVFAGVVAFTFVMVAIVFILYDIFVQRRNNNLMMKTAQTNAIVSSMIPEHLRNRIEQEIQEAQKAKKNKKGQNLKSFIHDRQDHVSMVNLSSKPMADLFVET